MNGQGLILGIDVGGTYTDLIAAEPKTGQIKFAKTPSTPENQAFGVLNAVHESGIGLDDTASIVHGTTTTTNAVLERKLSRTGLITTQGFRDVLELGRRTRPQAYGMTGKFTPIIPRDLRLEVKERMDAEGRVVEDLDEDAVREAAIALLAQGCEALVIHFLHSYANPAHELAALKAVQSIWPNDFITMGHALLSESREFERGVTACVNASVQPILKRYIERLCLELGNHGYDGEVLVMNGNGGMVPAASVAQEAAKTVMSGPASGVIAAAVTGRACGIENLITYDMGGTSSDVALIRNAEPAVSSEIEIEYAMPIHVPMVDVRTLGAGGGSIARINAGGLLEVGPESAGAVPGPICYGRGGTEPTISDANLLLGRLDPTKLNAVRGLAFEDVERAFLEQLGIPLGLSAKDAAAAVIRVANTKMAGAIRMVSISLGADPRDYALFTFGGAGPLHACALARELGIPKVLVPARPGITNALGCVLADLRHDFVQTLNKPLAGLDEALIHQHLAGQAQMGDALLAKETDEILETGYVFSADMQFVGQSHVLRVPLLSGKPGKDDLLEAFNKVYFERFRIDLADVPVNLVNLNCSVIGRRPSIDPAILLDRSERKTELAQAQTGERVVGFDGRDMLTPVYWREHLPVQFSLNGPAIIEQMDTTTLIEPGDRVSSDAIGNLVIEVVT